MITKTIFLNFTCVEGMIIKRIQKIRVLSLDEFALSTNTQNIFCGRQKLDSLGCEYVCLFTS